MSFKLPQIHQAIDRRSYSSDLQREVDSKVNAKKELAKLGINITYFPAGSFYVGFKVREGRAPEIITEDCRSMEACIQTIGEYLTKQESLERGDCANVSSIP